MILAVEIEMRFCCDHRVGFILPPHVDGKMGEVPKKTMVQRIIEGVVGRTVE